MSKSSVKRAHRTGERRSSWRRPIAAVAIGSLGVVGLGGPSAPAAPAAAAASRHFEGTFSAAPSYIFGDERCAGLGGDYLSDASVYTYDFPEEDWTSEGTACATTSGNPVRYTQAGTFTITRPGGTLTGSFASSNLLPVPADHVGVSHVTDGTGLYEDASGTCTLTDWQGLSGTVTCDISPK